MTHSTDSKKLKKYLPNINTVIGTLLSLCLLISVHSDLYAGESKGQDEELSVPVYKKTNDKTLSPCPDSPNCVSSQISINEKHYIKPLSLTGGSIQNNQKALLEALAQLDRVNIVVNSDSYIKAEFTSKLFKYVDDIEFIITDTHIDVRSASREGYYDLNANRKRVENIRKILKELP